MRVIVTFIAIAGLTGLAPCARAQSSRTNCTGYGNTVNCNTTTTPDLGQMFAASAAARARTDAARHQSEDSRLHSVQALAAHQAEEDRSKRVGTLVADGKCGDAKDLALREGDLDLAAKVQTLCVR